MKHKHKWIVESEPCLCGRYMKMCDCGERKMKNPWLGYAFLLVVVGIIIGQTV